MRKLPVVFAFAVLLLGACKPGNRYVQFSGYAQGGTYTVKLNMKGVAVPVESIRDSVDALLLQIDTTLSGYNKRSLLSRFNAGEAIPAAPMFLEMYGLSRLYWERSGGAVDCAAGALFNAWGWGFRHQEFPTEKEIRSLLAAGGMAALPSELPVEGGLIVPQEGFPQLNFNAIAQGYSADLIAAFLYRVGVKDMLVDIGEIWADGQGPSGQPWAVGVDRPVDQEEPSSAGAAGLEGVWSSGGLPAGIVTSGNYRKFYIRDGQKYAHTVDPRSGYPVQHRLLSATVVSKRSAAEADAVATWCMVVGPEKARSIILSDEALEGYLISADDEGGMAEWVSPGFTLRQ